MTSFDNRTIDADAPSYVKANLSWEAAGNHVIAAKKVNYCLAIEDLGNSLIPLVQSKMMHFIGNMLLTSSGWLVAWHGSVRNRSVWWWPGWVQGHNLLYSGLWTFACLAHGAVIGVGR